MTDEPNLQILLHKIRESYASVSHFPFASLKNKITSHFPCLPIHKNNARLSEIESARADINLSRGRSLIARKKNQKASAKPTGIQMPFQESWRKDSAIIDLLLPRK